MKRNMNVGITTWVGNESLNYGSMLQATAMQELIKKCGCTPITIDFILPLSRIPKEGKGVLNRFFQQFLNDEMTFFKTKWLFHRFWRKNMKASRPCRNDVEVIAYAKQHCQILLCGSDAIWKDDNFMRPRFLWDYEELAGFPKIAYGPSLAYGEISYPNMRQALDGFVRISGRETIMKKKLLPYTDKEISIVLDPTLAVDEDFWEKRTLKPIIKEPYILCYFLAQNSLHRVSIEKIRKKHRVDRILYINTNFIDNNLYVSYCKDYGDENYKKAVGPRQFLTLIKNSVAVCTDSFHGAAFSIVFKRNFYIFDKPMLQDFRDNYRIPDLLQRLGIEDRWVEFNECIDQMKDIDWDVVRNQLNSERKQSTAFLQEAIQQAIINYDNK